MKVSFRQGIIRHQTDVADNPLFLQTSGSTVTLYVSPDPTIFTATYGMAEYLYTEPTTVNSAWFGPFSPGTDYWLYWDISLTTGLRTFGHTLYEPIEQSTPPPSPVLDQHWFNTIERKWFIWQGDVWSPRIRVFAAKYTNGTSFESMSINAPIFTGTQVGLTLPHLSGGIAFDKNGKPIRNSDNTFFTTEDLFTAAVPEGSSLKINMIIVNATAQEPLAAFQVVMLSDFNEIVSANPYLQSIAVFGILEEDVPTGETARFVTEGRLTNDQWDWVAAGADANDPVYVDLTGALVLTPAIADQAPAGQIIDKQTIIFRPATHASTGGSDFSGQHGDLLGLDNDDHPQYHNDVRGDIRYYSRVTLDPILAGKADAVHTHVKADILDFAHTHVIADVSGLQAALDAKVSLSGDTMTGFLTLNADPVDPLHSATKQYVDSLSYISTIQDEGGNVAGSPHTTLNFTGDGITASDGGSGVVTVNVTGGAAGGTKIEDTDGDTYVDVESTPDADIIVMALGTAPNSIADDFIAATVVTLGRESLDFTALSATSATYGGAINLTGGNTNNDYGYGGDVNITGGNNTSTSGFSDGGDVNLTGGKVSASYGFPGPGGVNISAGADDTGAFSGDIRIVNQPVSATGGDVIVQASDAASGSGGSVDMSAGDGLVGGRVVIAGGVSSNTSSPIAGDVTIQGGGVVSGFAGGGEVRIFTGSSNDAGQGGKFTVDCGSGATFGGDILLEAGTGFSARGGYARIEGGNATNHNGGLVDLRGGNTSSDNLAHFGGIVTVEGGSSYFGYGRGGDIVLLSGEGPGPSQTQPGTYGAGNIELVVRGNTLAANGVVQIKSTSIDFLPVHNPELQLFSDSVTTHVKIQAPTSLAGNTQFTLPPDNGTVDYVLRTDGSGVTTWVAAAGGGGGSSSRIEDADMDTFVDTEYDGNDNEVHIHLGQDVGGRTAGPVAEFTQFDTVLRTLNSDTSGNTGSIQLLAGHNTTPSGNMNGGSIRLTAGDSDNGNAGHVVLTAGESYSSADSFDNGGDISINGGSAYEGSGGNVAIQAGYSEYGTAGDVFITGGYGYYRDNGNVFIETTYSGWSEPNTPTGNITIETGNNTVYGSYGVGCHSGDVSIKSGFTYHGAYGANSGDVTIETGYNGCQAAGNVGTISLIGGNATYAPNTGGNIVIQPGTGVSGNGTVVIDGTTMPQDTPAVGEVLQTDATGVTSWETVQYIEQFAANTSFTVTHNLGQRWCTVQVYNTSTGVNVVPTSVTLNSTTQSTVVIGASTAVTVVVIGMANVPVN